MDNSLGLAGSDARKLYLKQIVFVGAFFFIFGFVTWVNGALIPYLRIACELSEFQSYLVTFAFYISYAIMAIPSGKIIKWKGMLGAMQAGLYTMSLGCIIFIPAAYYRAYPLFLLGLFFIGTGLTLLQTAVNPFVTLLGDIKNATQRISIMGACNKFAGLLAPLIFSALVLNNSGDLTLSVTDTNPELVAARLNQLAGKVMGPYAALAIVLALIAFVVKYSSLTKVKINPGAPQRTSTERVTSNYTGQTVAGFMAIFLCVGAEVVAGDTIANYGIYKQIDWAISKQLTSVTLFCMFLGCIFGALMVPKYIRQKTALLFSGLLGIGIVLLVLLLPGTTSVYAVALLGFANALLWPAIWPQALIGLSGDRLRTTSAVLIMGIAGGAIMPLVYGKLAELFDNQWAYAILLPCYLFLIIYGLMGGSKRL